MLKLLLGHWQSHRQPLPFVLTDDPLYCSHLATTRARLPEVYSVNRVNPIFEEDEGQTRKDPADDALPEGALDAVNQFRTFPAKTKRSRSPKDATHDALAPNFVLRKPPAKTRSNAFEYSSRTAPDFETRSLRRSSSEETETNDTGYSSGGRASDGSSAERPMSSDSDDCLRTDHRVVVVSADVHRVSAPEDVLVRSPSSESSANYSYRSYGSSPEPFDSLTMSSSSSSKERRSHSAVKERLQRLLDKGSSSQDLELQRTKNDLMKSLTRALNSKVPKDAAGAVVTRSDDSKSSENSGSVSNRPPSASSSTTPKAVLVPSSSKDSGSDSSGVTRQDESVSSSLSSFPKKHHPQHKSAGSHQSSQSHQKQSKEPSTDSASHQHQAGGGHRCKACDRRPFALHQLLPGHWSYDNVYLPQVVCPCVRHHLATSVHHPDDVFLPRSRHSWALLCDSRDPKDGRKTSGDSRYSPDGETDSSKASSSRQLQRRSLREASRSCGCLACFPPDEKSRGGCSCLHRKMVKFASESDLSGRRPDPSLLAGLPQLNGGVSGKKKQLQQEKLPLPNLMPPFVPRGMKEPIKMEELYGPYPVNFRDWESHYRRNYLKKRKKRALAMVGMAIGIVVVVGLAVALTFVFLRIRRPAS